MFYRIFKPDTLKIFTKKFNLINDSTRASVSFEFAGLNFTVTKAGGEVDMEKLMMVGEYIGGVYTSVACLIFQVHCDE